MDTYTPIGKMFLRPESFDKRLKNYTFRYVVDNCWKKNLGRNGSIS